jgi:hypothetical protein
MALTDITRQGVLEAVREYDALGREAFLDKYGFGRAREYMLVLNGREYDSKAILGAAHGFSAPQAGPLRASEFSGGEATTQARLNALGFQVIRRRTEAEATSPEAIQVERKRREEMWRTLISEGEPVAVSPARLRTLRFYGGAAGIWTDSQETTSALVASGITVSFLHRGTRYVDDIWDDGLLYHYPNTARNGDQDTKEIEATKWAKRLGLPLFVITTSDDGQDRRRVQRAWIEEWDDDDKVFLVRFGAEAPPPIPEVAPDAPFTLEEPSKRGRAVVETRLGQQRFKLSCVRYYGHLCAVCDLDIPELLDGAHIRPKKKNGCDDPRNGLVLCASHHRAYDAALFAVDPDTLRIVTRINGPEGARLRLLRPSIQHLREKPHAEALAWAWSGWLKQVQPG